MSRYKAFGIHFFISLVVFLLTLGVMAFFWYPWPFFSTDGGWQGLRILIAVDLTIGPLLTLLVFRAGKPGLRLDLAIIALLQIGAYVGGAYIIHHQRLQLVVYANGAFYGLDHTGMAQIGAQGHALVHATAGRPPFVFVHLPQNRTQRLAIEMKVLRGEPPLYLRGWRYRPYNARARQHVLAHGLDITRIVGENRHAASALARFRQQHPHLRRYVFVPYHGTYRSVVLVLRRTNADIVGTLDFNPGY
ncbi:MAG: hypothetical protein ACYCXG_03095 [Acidiferrobacter sp.]